MNTCHVVRHAYPQKTKRLKWDHEGDESEIESGSQCLGYGIGQQNAFVKKPKSDFRCLNSIFVNDLALLLRENLGPGRIRRLARVGTSQYMWEWQAFRA